MQSGKASERKLHKRAAGGGVPITWPPGEPERNEIMRELPAEARARSRTAVEAAVQEYLTGSREPQSTADRRRQWQRVKRLAASKAFIAFCDVTRKLASYEPLDPELRPLLKLVDQLEELPKKAGDRALVYGLRNRKMRLRAALIRAWTDAGGFLGASEEGPLQRFLRQVLGRIGLRLTKRGVKAAIKREQERRSRLNVKHIGLVRPGWPDRRRVRDGLIGPEERRLGQVLYQNPSRKTAGHFSVCSFQSLVPYNSETTWRKLRGAFEIFGALCCKRCC